jgi:signal transduction histidine kinase
MMSTSSPASGRYDPQVLLNSQPVIVTVIDPQTYTVQFQNETGLKKLGDIGGQTCYQKIADCSTPCSFCKMSEAVTTGRITESEVPLPDDRYLLVQWSKAETAEGRTHVIETITDITQRKRLEAETHRLQKMETISRLSGSLAHNFNNLLTVMIGYSEQLLHEPQIDTRHREQVLAIRQAAETAAHITRKLLTISGRQRIRPAVLDLNQVVTGMEADLHRLLASNVLLKIQPDSTPHFVTMDREQLQQMLVGLVANAGEAMSNGGIVTVATGEKTVDADTARRHTVHPGSYAALMVGDTGCGMDEETQRHLFEPGFTKKGLSKGSGLGLAVIDAMVRQGGGFIEVMSKPNAGSIFTIWLPSARDGEAVATTTPREAATARSGRVLLVDDDESVRTVIGAMLRAHGYEVREACDGLDALRIAESETNRVDLLLTDVMMPRMTGPQLLDRLEAIMPRVKVLFMSGYSGDILEPDRLAHRPFLQKPFSPQTLVEKVQAVLVG